MQINRENFKWTGRMALILLLVAAADGLIVAFVRKPFPWVLLIPSLIPVLAVPFVILPVLRAERAKAPGA